MKSYVILLLTLGLAHSSQAQEWCYQSNNGTFYMMPDKAPSPGVPNGQILKDLNEHIDPELLQSLEGEKCIIYLHLNCHGQVLEKGYISKPDETIRPEQEIFRNAVLEHLVASYSWNPGQVRGGSKGKNQFESVDSKFSMGVWVSQGQVHLMKDKTRKKDKTL